MLSGLDAATVSPHGGGEAHWGPLTLTVDFTATTTIELQTVASRSFYFGQAGAPSQYRLDLYKKLLRLNSEICA